MQKIIKSTILLFALMITSLNVYPCTNFIVTKGASADGSVMVTYNADAGGFMDPLYFSPAQKHTEEFVDVYEWDSDKHLGKIKQVPYTYSVVGNINEYQVAIGETTFTGREELRDTNALVDYGSLIYLALQRSKTAREALKVMTDLVAEYGYYSSGESFTVADANEAWILEMISKGPNNKGAVWVAVRIPDGYVSAHANQARIREFPLNDKENCIYSPDVIDFATKKGYYDPKSGKRFSFVDAYCPLDPGNALYCEGRVWSLFRKAAPSLKFKDDYWRAVKGAEPYPLYIKPDKKLNVQDVIGMMRDHFEGTEYDMTKGLAAEPFGNPYRWKPLEFKIEGDTMTYGWERPISSQQSAFTFVTQARAHLPNHIGGIMWYGVDDNYSNVYIPLYCGIKDIPPSFTGGSIQEFDFNKGFWVFNLVANLAYTKYSYIIKEIQPVQKELEDKFFAYQPAIEQAALELNKKDAELARDYLTEYSINQSELTVARWQELWKYLVVRYNDGYINDVNVERGRHPKGVGYGNDFFKRVVKERPGYYDVKWK